MDADNYFAGSLTFVLLVSVVLTAPLSFFLLWLYRRAVLKGMGVAAGVEEATPPLADGAPAPHKSLRTTIITRSSQPIKMGAGSRLEIQVERSLRRVALSYVTAGLAFGLLSAAAWSLATEGSTFRGFVLNAVRLSWPIALALGLLLALAKRDWLRYVGIYALVLGIVGTVAITTSTTLTLGLLLEGWLITSGEVTLALAAFLTRRIRAVGPLVLAFLTSAVAGAFLSQQAIGSSPTTEDALLRILATPLVWLLGEHALSLGGLAGRACFCGTFVPGLAILAVLGWWLLQLVGRRYRKKRLSDQSLMLDTIWLLFAVGNAISLSIINLSWFFGGVLIFFVYKLVLSAMLARFARPAAVEAPGPTLLLLRVFSLGPRSLRLFDALAKHWLRAGPIMLIAGPDLVTGIVEPPEFLDFVGGRVSRRFVQGKDDLEQRLAQLDTRPDPDGRHRVNEFFCRADTWQMTMQQLAARSDAVLMDLRSFSPSNRGCLYELEQLLNGVYLPQVLLIVDATTDLGFLEESLQELWRNVPFDSPNRRLPDPEVRLYRVDSGTGAEARGLLRLLYGQVRPTAVLEPVGAAI
jgi:hypothetical protein